MKQAKPAVRNPWAWVPSLYLAEGTPYVMAMTVSVILYKRLGISNTDIALYTSWLYLPWVIKPLWSPFVDMFRTKRFWIVAMQLADRGVVRLRGAHDPGARILPLHPRLLLDHGLQLGHPRHRRRRLLHARPQGVPAGGLRRGADDLLPDRDDRRQGDPRRPGRDPGDSAASASPSAWSVTFFLLAAIMLALFLYHLFVLPYPGGGPAGSPRPRRGAASAAFLRGFVLFFRRKDILAVLAFFLFYRFAEAQLVKMVAPFLLDPRTKGGLGLIDRGGGDRLRDGRGDCADARGASRRLGHLPERAQILALDHGLRDAPAGCDLHLALPGDAGEPLADQRRRGGRSSSATVSASRPIRSS